MKEPRRWLEDARELSALELRVLEAAERTAAPEASKRQVWTALSAALPLAPTPPEVSPSLDGSGLGTATAGTGGAAQLGTAAAGTKTVLALSALKALGVGFALGAAAVGGSSWLGSSTAGRASAPPAAVTATRNAPLAASERPAQARPPLPAALPATSVEARLASASRAGAPTGPAPSAAADVERVEPGAARAAFPDALAPVVTAPPVASAAAPALDRDRARLESQRVAEARRALRTGNPRAALALLESVVREFPNGVLVQEREALSIDALLSCGERAAARARALDFVARYPGSPHTLAVQRALE